MQINVKSIQRWMALNSITNEIASNMAGVDPSLFSKYLSGTRPLKEQNQLKLWAHMQRYRYTGAESCPAMECA